MNNLASRVNRVVYEEPASRMLALRSTGFCNALVEISDTAGRLIYAEQHGRFVKGT